MSSSNVVFIDEKKPLKKPLTFYDCSRPVYLMSRLFGLFPFTVHYDSNGCMQRAAVGAFDGVWFIGAITLNLFLAYLMLIQVKSSIEEKSSAKFIAGRIIFTVNFVMVVAFIVLDMINRHRLVNTIKEIIKFDTSVRKFDILTVAK